jgi:hypothetical protein
MAGYDVLYFDPAQVARARGDQAGHPLGPQGTVGGPAQHPGRSGPTPTWCCAGSASSTAASSAPCTPQGWPGRSAGSAPASLPAQYPSRRRHEAGPRPHPRASRQRPARRLLPGRPGRVRPAAGRQAPGGSPRGRQRQRAGRAAGGAWRRPPGPLRPRQPGRLQPGRDRVRPRPQGPHPRHLHPPHPLAARHRTGCPPPMEAP